MTNVPHPPQPACYMDRKAVVKYSDMTKQMEDAAIECAAHALEKYKIEKEIAVYIR